MNRKSSRKKCLTPKKGEINKMTKKYCKNTEIGKKWKTHIFWNKELQFYYFFAHYSSSIYRQIKKNVFSPYSDQNGKKNLKSRYKKRPKNDIFPQKTILQDPSGSWVKFITSPLKILQFGTGKTGAHLGQSLKKVWKLLFFDLSLTTCVSSPNGLLGCFYRPRQPKTWFVVMYLGRISVKNRRLDPPNIISIKGGMHFSLSTLSGN